MSELVTLYEDDQLVALHRPGGSDFTLITFADLTARPRPGWFWGLHPAARLDWDCIGLIAKRSNWYPVANMQRCAAALAGIGRPTRIGYGYSMGGYAVLKHGARLGLTHGLAVAPQVTIDPTDGLRDRRFLPHADPALHTGMRVRAEDLPGWTAVVADPLDPEDREHLDHLPTHPGLHRVPVPLIGHAAIWLLTSTAALDAAIRRVRARDEAGLRHVLRDRRAGLDRWFLQAGGAALRGGHMALADRLLNRAATLGAGPALVAEYRALGLAQLARRRHEAGRPATDLAIRAVAALPAHPDLHERVGLHILKVDPGTAETVLRPLGDRPQSLFGLSHILRERQDLPGALQLGLRAAMLRPDLPELLAWVAHLLIGLGRARPAEALFRAALRRDPLLLHAAIGLSRALSIQGRVAASRAVVTDALTRWPDDPVLLRRQRLLRQPGPRLWLNWLRHRLPRGAEPLDTDDAAHHLLRALLERTGSDRTEHPPA